LLIHAGGKQFIPCLSRAAKGVCINRATKDFSKFRKKKAQREGKQDEMNRRTLRIPGEGGGAEEAVERVKAGTKYKENGKEAGWIFQ